MHVQVRNQIEINAQVSAVWDVLTDVETWPKWTPTVSFARVETPGPLSVGSTVLLRQPLQKPAQWKITELKSPHRFIWETKAGSVRFRAEHNLETIVDGTRSGLVLDAWGRSASLLRPALALALFLENRALKRRVERQ